MSPITTHTRARMSNRFEDLLPNSTDPAKMKFRARMVMILNSQGEIVPASKSPLGQLWRLVNATNSSIDECEDVIKLDPALTSRIFRVANSAAYHARATDISEAVRFIGFKRVRELVFNAGVLDQLKGLKVPPEMELFWLRNIFVARLAERIASNYFTTDGSEYLAGLIHDIGWLFLATHFPDEHKKIMASEKMPCDAEKDVLPFGHASIAAALAARSAVPLRAVDAINYHHKQMLTTTSTLIAPNQNPLFLGIILAVCDKLADASQLDFLGKSTETMETFRESPEVVWLNNYQKNVDFEEMAVEELTKSQEIHQIFFSEEPATAG